MWAMIEKLRITACGVAAGSFLGFGTTAIVPRISLTHTGTGQSDFGGR
jgi:hypothetical protein